MTEEQKNNKEQEDGIQHSIPEEGLKEEEGNFRWYVIHTYSGYELKVAEYIHTKLEVAGEEYRNRVRQILVPTEDVVEMRGGKKKVVAKVLYSGYVFVYMDLNDEMWHLIRRIPRVTGFLGGGGKPQPLSKEEVKELMDNLNRVSDKPRPSVTFSKGDAVKIIDGPFKNFTGIVDEVNEEKSSLKVSVTIFGRPTPVVLKFLEVEKL